MKPFIYALLIVIISLSLNLTVFSVRDSLYLVEAAQHYRYFKLCLEDRIPVIDYDFQHPEGIAVFKNTLFTPCFYAFFYRLTRPFLTEDDYITRKKFIAFSAYFLKALSAAALFLFLYVIFKKRLYAFLSAIVYCLSIAVNWRLGPNNIYNEHAVLFFVYIHILSLFYIIKFKERRAFFTFLNLACLFIALAGWKAFKFFFLAETLILIVCYFIYYDKRSKKILRYYFLLYVFSILLIPHLRAGKAYFGINFGVLFCFFTLSFFKIKKIKFAVFYAAALFLFLFAASRVSAETKQFGHVWSVLFYQFRYFFIKPDSPALLNFDARLYWVPPYKYPSLLRFFNDFIFLIIPYLTAFVYFVLRFIKKREKYVFLMLAFNIFFLCFYGLFYKTVVFFIVFAAFLICAFLSETKNKGLIVLTAVLIILNSAHCFLWVDSPALGFLRQGLGLRDDYYFPPPHPNEVRDVINQIKKLPRGAYAGHYGYLTAVLAFTDNPIALHSYFESYGLRRKIKEFSYALYEDEAAFYNFCKKYNVSYFLYSADLLLDDSKMSYRYLTDNLKLSPDSLIYKFQYRPGELTKFGLVYENRYFRIYGLNSVKP